MSDYIEEFLIAIGLDASDLSNGLDNVRNQVANLVGSVSDDIKRAGEEGSKAGAVSALSFDRGAERIRLLGKASKETASAIASSFRGLGPVVDSFRSRLFDLVSTFALITGSVQAFSSYIEQSDSLGKLSMYLGISVKELDAFGKAAEAAGGSAESMFASMRSYYEQTGRPAKEVFQLASKVEGMSRAAAQRYLQAQGVATDAIPIFLKGQKALDDLMNKYRQTAFTAQDAKTARAFKVAWMDFKASAQSAGNVLARIVVPMLTKLLDGLTRLIRIIDDNRRAFSMLAVAFWLVFGIKSIKAVKQAIVAIRMFGTSLKLALLPLTALIAGVAGLALAIDDLLGFAEGADSLFERILRNFGMSNEEIESLRYSFNKLGEAFGKAWDFIKPYLGSALTVVFKGLAIAITTVVSLITGLIAGIVTVWNKAKDLKQSFDDLCQGAIDWLNDLDATIGAWGESIGELFTGIPDAISSALSSAWDSVVAWFARWPELIAKSIGEPIKEWFSGIGNFFSFGSDDDDDKPQPTNEGGREKESVASQRAAYQANSPTVTTNANMNVVNNITTKDSPVAIARAVEGSVGSGFNRQAALIGQSMGGVNLK